MSIRNRLKTLLRSPLRSVLTLALLVAVSFVFVTRAGEAYITSRELNRASEQYAAAGWLEPSDGSVPSQAAERLAASQYVRSTETVRVAAAVSEQTAPLTDELLEFENRLFVVGQVQMKRYVSSSTQMPSMSLTLNISGENGAVGGITDMVDGDVSLYVNLFTPLVYAPEGYGEQVPQELIDLYDSIQEGEQYLFCLSATRTWNGAIANNTYVVQPFGANGEFFYKLERGEVFDPSDYPTVAEQLERADQHAHTQHAVAVGNMAELPVVMYDITLREGRWLTPDDTGTTVISNDLAVLHNLSVGDRLPLELLNVHSNNHLGFGDTTDAESVNTTFEVVGIYDWAKNPDSSFKLPGGAIFVPQSALPDTWTRGGYTSSGFGFILNSPDDMQSFIAENAVTLSELGCEIRFMPNDWEQVRVKFANMRFTSTLNLLAMAAATLLALGLTVYLFILRKKREYAIMRALGVGRLSAGVAHTFSLGLLAAVAISIGGTMAWFAARNAMARSFATVGAAIPGGFEFSVVLPVWFIAAVAVGVFAVALLLAAAGLAKLGRMPVLGLLQGGKAKRVRKPEKVTPDASPLPLHGIPPLPSTRGYHAASQVMRYVMRHMRRSYLKSLLVLIVPAVLIAALGVMQYNISLNQQRIDELYETTEVEGYIALRDAAYDIFPGTGAMQAFAVDSVMESGYIRDSYREIKGTCDIFAGIYKESSDDYEIQIIDGASIWVNKKILGDDRHFLSANKMPNGLADVQFADGITAKTFLASDDLCLVSRSLVEAGNLKPGDYVTVQVFGTEMLYSSALPSSSTAGALDFGKVDYRQTGSPYLTLTIAGVHEGDADVVLPLGIASRSAYNTRYSEARFTLDPSLNRRLNEFRDEINYAFEQAVSVGMKMLVFRLHDEELTQVVEGLEQNSMVLKNIYPILLAAAVMIAAIMPGLVVLQSSHEASIMRVLGTSKRRVRAMLTTEQVLLCISGLAVGVAGLFIYTASGMSGIVGAVVLCVSLYVISCLLGTLFGAITVTKRNVLELLQTKE